MAFNKNVFIKDKYTAIIYAYKSTKSKDFRQNIGSTINNIELGYLINPYLNKMYSWEVENKISGK